MYQTGGISMGQLWLCSVYCPPWTWSQYCKHHHLIAVRPYNKHCLPELQANWATTPTWVLWRLQGAPKFDLQSTLKAHGDFSWFTDDQYKLCYVYGFLMGNVEKQIQLYVLADRINYKNVEAFVTILKAACRDPDQVGITSAKLDKLSQGNKEFSQYYAKF